MSPDPSPLLDEIQARADAATEGPWTWAAHTTADGDEWAVFDGGDSALGFRRSADVVRLDDWSVPDWVEVEYSDPEGQVWLRSRVDVAPDVGPRVTRLEFLAVDGEPLGIRQCDLRGVEVAAIAEYSVALFARERREVDGGLVAYVPVMVESQLADAANKLRGGMRAGATTRGITPQLLERVARVYRANIDQNPNKAIELEFGVAQRTAAEYVSRARKRGLLPPTTRGRKRA